MAAAPILAEDFSWPLRGEPDGADAGFTLSNAGASVTDLAIGAVTRPRLFGYRPKTPNGSAVMVLAGGGYTQLVVGKEGVEVAQWLASIGFHVFVLVHRFPNAQFGPSASIDDAIEAMRLIRARAAELGVKQVGVVGLSSGGHLAACLVANYPAGWSAPASAHADQPSRPDFLVVAYGPISTNAKGRTIVPNKPALPPPEKQAMYDAAQPDAMMIDHPPPTFIVYSASDAVVPDENAIRLFTAVRAKGAPAELHVFAEAAHGFALREKALPIGVWPKLCEAWLRQHGVRIT